MYHINLEMLRNKTVETVIKQKLNVYLLYTSHCIRHELITCFIMH